MKKRVFSMLVTLCMLCALVPAFPVWAAGKADVEIGDYVRMGAYYGEPILWRCVDVDDNGPLMFSNKILAIKAYDAAGYVATYSGIRPAFYLEQDADFKTGDGTRNYP